MNRRSARSDRRAPALRPASRVLADAFADDPWAAHVLGATGHDRQRALARLMTVPVACAALHGAVVTIPFDEHDGRRVAPHVREPAAVGAWVPSSARHVGLRTAVRVNAVRLPLEVGLATMRRLWSDEGEISHILNAHLTDHDAYLWVLGVRRRAHAQGMGRRVVDLLSRDAAQVGHRRIVLHTDTPGNVEIYRRLGFTRLDEQLRTSGLRCHVLARSLSVHERGRNAVVRGNNDEPEAEFRQTIT